MKQINIMIVDDHQIIIDGLKALFNSVKNISVVAEANNGKDAIAILEKTPVDIILMDIEMPVLNGYDAATIITSKYPELKIIALTTYDEKFIVQKMITAGALGYILKNIDKEVLIKAINTVIKGETFFSSEIPIILSSHTSEETILPQTQSSYNSLLSPREIEILKYIANGLSNIEISQKLFISSKTVDTHRTNIMKKLNIHNVVGLVKYAIKSGLIN